MIRLKSFTWRFSLIAASSLFILGASHSAEVQDREALVAAMPSLPHFLLVQNVTKWRDDLYAHDSGHPCPPHINCHGNREAQYWDALVAAMPSLQYFSPVQNVAKWRDDLYAHGGTNPCIPPDIDC